MNAESVTRYNVTREFRHGTRGESARRCIGEIKKGSDIFGLTKGDFSMVDILRHVAKQIGPCRVDIGSWTAGKADISEVGKMVRGGLITDLRLILGDGFPVFEKKGYEAAIAELGRSQIRFARFHAKYALMESDGFSVAIRTSMNLNMNRRIESYEISEGSEISDYLRGIADHHFDQDTTAYAAFAGFDVIAPVVAPPVQKLGGWD